MSTADNKVCVKTIGELALEVARTQIGVCEDPKGSNGGPVVSQYLRNVGLKPGYAWCQAAVYSWYLAASAKMSHGGIVNPVPRTAGVRDCWNKVSPVKKVERLTALSHPERILPGAQFFLGFRNGTGHTGIVVRVEYPFYFTIEGNSNSDGSREGYEVVEHQRRLDAKELLGFAVY